MIYHVMLDCAIPGSISAGWLAVIQKLGAIEINTFLDPLDDDSPFLVTHGTPSRHLELAITAGYGMTYPVLHYILEDALPYLLYKLYLYIIIPLLMLCGINSSNNGSYEEIV